MRHALLSATGYWLLATIFLSGCGSTVPGLRLAPGEEQKQAAQTADDLAKGLAHTGAQPGSPAATTLARSTGPPRAYAGQPRNPVDVTPLIEAERGAWELKNDQITAWKLKGDLSARAGAIVSAAMADLAELVEVKKKINSTEIIQRVGSIVGFHKMTAELTSGIPVPADKQISASEQALIDAITAHVDRIDAAAGEAATARPTLDDVEDEALDTIGRIGSVLESYGLLALIPGAGGVFYAARKRKAAKDAKSEADAARHDEANARHAAEMVKADADAVAARAMELLAQAPPKGTSNE